MAVSVHTGAWPRTTAYVPSTGENMCMHNFQTQAVYGYTGSIRVEKTVEFRARPHGMPYDHPRVTGILVFIVFVYYLGVPCDLGNILGIISAVVQRYFVLVVQILGNSGMVIQKLDVCHITVYPCKT